MNFNRVSSGSGVARYASALLVLVTVLMVGVVRAQDDDGEGIPIQPAQPTAIPSPTVLPTVTQPPVQETTVVVTTEEAVETEEAPAVATQVILPTIDPLAPTVETTPEPLRATVDVSSAFVRAAPAPDAPPVASAFRDDVLDVIGRNLDGTYFEVARPYRPDESIGWVSIEVIDYELLPELLPLTDIETGVVGDSPLASPVDFGVFINEGVALRALPDIQRGDRLLNIPPSVTVPVLGRYRDGEWLLVNYLGTEGWIIGFVIRDRDGIETLPEITGILPGDTATLRTEIIPPEIQRAQLERLREYATERATLARDVEAFWWLVQQGEVLPCNPPASVQAYRYGPRDVQELPEIDRYIPRMLQGVDMLNESIDVLDNCGVLDPFDVQRARNDAINAKVILENTLVQLDNLEEIIDFNS